MLKVACPKCAKSLGLPDTAAGKSVKCPKCQQVFKAPAAAAAAKPIAAAVKTPGTDDEATPYALQEVKLSPEQVRKSAQSEDVDAMVIDAQRTKIRNKAWDKVGMPSKFVKRAALTACIIWICTYLFVTMIVVLAAHNVEQAARTGGKIMTGGVASLPKYLFLQDIDSSLNPQNVPPLAVWGIASGCLVVALAIYGLQLAGAEKMKKLEGYRLAMFSMIVGTLSLNLFAILGLLALMDKGVQYEFRVSQRRLEGKSGEELYNEDTGEEDDEDEDDEEEEDEDDEEEEVASKRVAKRR